MLIQFTLIPLGDGELTRDDRSVATMAIFEDLHQVKHQLGVELIYPDVQD